MSNDKYLGTRIKEVLDEMGIECINLQLGEYNMDDDYIITRNYGIKLPRKKAAGIKGVFGITTPTISLLDIVKKVNEKLEVTPTNPSPKLNRYYVSYIEHFGSMTENVNLYLDGIVQKSTRPFAWWTDVHVFCFKKYARNAERLAKQGCI